jgi:L-alanine-DL-glutamate epimerase-like enolase superfamily enzyme
MKITAVRTIALSGATHDHGWPGGTDPDEQKNTLLEVNTDEGITGIGSCYTSRALVEASLQLLHPMLIGETGLEAERVAEKLRQMTFWQGRGGAVEHTISGIDIALWDLQGQALGQPVSRLLGGNYRDRIKPYASILFEDPPVLRDRLLAQTARGFRAIKMGWRPFGRVSRKLDELLIKTARETVGEDVELMVDAGGSEQFWPHGYKWALETAKMLADFDVVWFEEALPPDDFAGFAELRGWSSVSPEYKRGQAVLVTQPLVDRRLRHAGLEHRDDVVAELLGVADLGPEHVELAVGPLLGLGAHPLQGRDRLAVGPEEVADQLLHHRRPLVGATSQRLQQP